MVVSVRCIDVLATTSYNTNGELAALVLEEPLATNHPVAGAESSYVDVGGRFRPVSHAREAIKVDKIRKRLQQRLAAKRDVITRTITASTEGMERLSPSSRRYVQLN